jgi:hypothetical protein
VSPNADRDRLQILSHSTLYTSLDPHGYAITRFAPGCVMTSFGFAALFGDRFFGRLAVALDLLTRPLAVMLFLGGLVIRGTVKIPHRSGYRLSVVRSGVFLLIALRGGERVFHRSAGGQRILRPMIVSPEAIRLSQPARRDDVPTFSATLAIVFDDASSRWLEISAKPRLFEASYV